MAQSPLSSPRRDELAEANLREWALKARMISRENTKSRRFSSSYITSLREDSRSFRSSITISTSTASSPGHNLKDEIDPSTYSFTTALRALQARSVNTWECLSPEGFALNSKWNEAEKYISNPLSGEFPMECLSAKTLNGRSFHNLTNRITMSAPLIYPSHSRFIPTTPFHFDLDDDEEHQIDYIPPIKEKKVGNMTRDVGVQSTPTDLTSNSATPASSPQTERSINKLNSEAGGNSQSSSIKLVFMQEEGELKATSDRKEEAKGEEKKTDATATKATVKQHENMQNCRREGGCLSLRNLWMRRKHEKRDNKAKAKPSTPRMKKTKNIFPLPC